MKVWVNKLKLCQVFSLDHGTLYKNSIYVTHTACPFHITKCCSSVFNALSMKYTKLDKEKSDQLECNHRNKFLEICSRAEAMA